jgi:alkanesulfonate monooxygenase SsuD/methylene tetrahydromethanopterin reductase-like flavin-dependent oxidoreductase (luciferase family)
MLHLIQDGIAGMKFALHFGNNTFSDPEGARRLVRLAEAAGFDSVFACSERSGVESPGAASQSSR